MKNIVPKIVVAISAVVLWYLIVSSQTYVSVVNVPLDIYEPREEMTIAEALPKTIKVRVEGSARTLYFDKWTEKSLLILDVGAIENSQTISLKEYFKEKPNQVRLQGDLQFLEVVYPDSIDIKIDTKIFKTVPVNVQYDISARSGFILIDDEAKYEVSITGPKSTLDNIQSLHTILFKKDNVDISFTEDIAIQNPNPDLILMEPEKLKVNVGVEMIGEINVSNIPISIKNKPDDLDIQFIPNTVSLRVTGGNTQIQSLTKYDFTVYFDYLTQWFPNKNYYPLKIISPDKVLDVIRVNPEQVEVVVMKKTEEENGED